MVLPGKFRKGIKDVCWSVIIMIYHGTEAGEGGKRGLAGSKEQRKSDGANGSGVLVRGRDG